MSAAEAPTREPDKHIALGGEVDARQLVAAIQHAEVLEFSRVWLPDQRFMRDCYAVLAAAAFGTDQIELASGVSDPFSRHPALLAMTVATLNEIAPDRIVLGMGAGGSGLDAIGLQRQRPSEALEVAINALRALLRGETVDAVAPSFEIKGVRLGFPVESPIPIAMVAHGPRMYRLAGRIADEVLVANVANHQGLEWALQRIDEGTQARDAELDRLRLTWRFDMCVSDDSDAAKAVLRERVKGALQSGYYGETFLRPMGLEGLVGRHAAEYTDEKVDIVVDAVAYAGDAEDVGRRMREMLKTARFDGVSCRVYLAPEQELGDALTLSKAALDQACARS